MKKVIVILALLVVGAFCMTDWKCVKDCTRQGYQWGLCKHLCTWCQ